MLMPDRVSRHRPIGRSLVLWGSNEVRAGGEPLLAIPIEGSHYLVDVIAAVPVALLAEGGCNTDRLVHAWNISLPSDHSGAELRSGHPEGLVPQPPPV